MLGLSESGNVNEVPGDQLPDPVRYGYQRWGYYTPSLPKDKVTHKVDMTTAATTTTTTTATQTTTTTTTTKTTTTTTTR